MLVRTLKAAIVATVAAAALAGCGGSPGPGAMLPQNQSPQAAERNSSLPSMLRFPAAEPPPKVKMLYVANRDGGDILGFPANATGNVAPTVTIDGTATLITNPVALGVDGKGRLLTLNDSGDEVLVFPKGADGSVAPEVIGGSKLPQFESEGVAVDHNGEIYVSSFSTNEIFVFKKGAHGNVKPIRTLSGGETQLSGPCGMAFDSENNLYVANYYANSSSSAAVEKFAPDANGNVAPIGALTGSNTGLTHAFAVSVDPNDRVIVGDYGGTAVLIFTTRLGNVAPMVTIAGSKTGLTDVLSTGVDSAGNIYVIDGPSSGSTGESILVFGPNANGNVKPKADITGSSTGLDDAFFPTVF